MRDKRPDLETLTDAARQHLAVSRGYHLIPENSRMLVLDSSVPFIVALRSLFDYRRPFGCVYYSGPGSFRQLFDAGVVIDVLLCIWHVERSLGFRRRFLEELGADLDTELVNFNIPNTFSCAPLLDQVCAATPSSGIEPTSGNEPMDWVDSTVPAVNTGGLWLQSLAGWQRLLGNHPSFPFMSCRRTALEAAEFMLLANLHFLPLWDDCNGSPLSFTSPSAILSHVIQTLRSEDGAGFSLLAERVVACTSGTDVVSIPMSSSLLDALMLLRRTGWSSLPLVNHQNEFEAFFSRHNFLQGLSRLLAEGQQLDLRMSIEDFMLTWMPSSARRGRLYTFNCPTSGRKDCPMLVDDDGLPPPTPGVSISAAHRVSNLLSSIICGSASVDHDLTFQEAMVHLVLSEDHRVVVVDRQT